MATKAADQHDSGTLNYKTWVLKVFIHCQGCKKKVKKVLQSIDGIYETTIDSKQHKVTVTGSVDEELLIKKLSKSGKYVQPWPQEKVAEKKDKKPAKSNNEKQKDTQLQAAADDPKKPEIAAAAVKHDGADSGKGQDAGDTQPPEGEQMGAESEEPADTNAESGGGGGGKKKKKKGKKDSPAGPNGDAPPGESTSTQSALVQPIQDKVPRMEPINQSPTNQPMYPYGPMYHGPPLFGVSYNNTNYPCSNSSYYDHAPTMNHSIAYGPPPPRPSHLIYHEDYDHRDYHGDDEEETAGCSIM